MEQNCEVGEITRFELIAPKLLSVIGKNTEDKELKKKIKRGNMILDEKADATHEHTYGKMNASLESQKKNETNKRERHEGQHARRSVPSAGRWDILLK